MAEESPTTQAKKVYATDRSARVVTALTEDLGFWKNRIDAALFLAALAIYRGEEPVSKDDLEGNVDMGNLYSVARMGDPKELILFKLALGSESHWEDVFVQQSKGLIEAGARIVEPVTEMANPAEGLHDLLSPEE